jgi:hypothetical protein
VRHRQRRKGSQPGATIRRSRRGPKDRTVLKKRADAHARSHAALIKSALAFTVSGHELVVQIVASATDQPASTVDDQLLKNIADCNQALRAAVAAGINRQWPNLSRRWTGADVGCDDTAQSLWNKVLKGL